MGYGGYAFSLNIICVLDCYGDWECFCSMANSSSNAIDSAGYTIHENVGVHISTLYFGLVTMKASKDVARGEEAFYDFGNEFVYPNGLNNIDD